MSGSARPRLLLASGNPGKLAELDRILSPLVPDLELIGLRDVDPYPEPAETEPTFAGNALIKADAGVAATGLPTIADDSGLCVDVLNGMPGVRSARWAGPAKDDADNNRLLLAQLDDVAEGNRTAQFRSAVAMRMPDGRLETSVGVMPGRIIGEQRGTGGFGYDVLFAADGYDVTTAELPAEEKDAISHLGRALRAIAPRVAALLLDPGRG